MSSFSPALLAVDASTGFLAIGTDFQEASAQQIAAQLIHNNAVNKVSFAQRATPSPINLRTFTQQAEKHGQLAGLFDFNFSSECMKVITFAPQSNVNEILSSACKGFHFTTQWVLQQYTASPALHDIPILCYAFFYVTGSGRNEIGVLLRHAMTGELISHALTPFYRPTSTDLKKKIHHVLTVMKAIYTTAKVVPESVVLAAERSENGEWMIHCKELERELANRSVQ